jgi:hypothetical protein
MAANTYLRANRTSMFDNRAILSKLTWYRLMCFNRAGNDACQSDVCGQGIERNCGAR